MQITHSPGGDAVAVIQPKKAEAALMHYAAGNPDSNPALRTMQDFTTISEPAGRRGEGAAGAAASA